MVGRQLHSYSRFILWAALFPAVMAAQSLTVTNFRFVSETPYFDGVSSWQTYAADLVNTGSASDATTATASTSNPFVLRVMPGQDTLQFPAVAAGSRVASTNTFTILAKQGSPVNFSILQWTIQGAQTAPPPPPATAPVANAGPNQTASVGATVTLNGSLSTNPSGVGTLTYAWAFGSRPAGSSAALINPTSVSPTFVADKAGTYTINLTVSNGVASSGSSVTVSTVNTPPVANAGANQTVALGATVILSGSGSTDVDGDPITYSWTLLSSPAGSAAVLTGPTTVSPTFVADKPGSYQVQLIVNDSHANSAPATVTITTGNTPPVANAGPNQSVNTGDTVHLTGAASTDVDGNSLTYLWSLITRPGGSAATLSSTTVVNPTFIADVQGTFVAQLVVHDGTVNSPPSTVTISSASALAPTANAGPNQTVAHNTTVLLSGSGTDPQSLPLSYHWSILSMPAGSTAVLNNAFTTTPTMFVGTPGTYVVQLIVNNGLYDSAPSTVTITTTNTRPVSNPGANQSVSVGASVQLNGSLSSDADNDSLTFAWSLTSRPAGSTAALFGWTTATPSFTADLAGSYVAQLIVSDGFQQSLPVTVTITAFSNGVVISPNPINLNASAQSVTVTLPAAAPAGGQVVGLTSFNPSVVTVPASVTVPAGQTSITFVVTPVANGSTTIMAVSGQYKPGSAAVNVGPASITVTLGSASTAVGQSITGTVTLSAAPPADVNVSLVPNPVGIVTLPVSLVTVPVGSTSATFTITGAAIGSTTIGASAAGYAGGSAVIAVTGGGIVLPANVTVAMGSSLQFPVSLPVPPSADVTVFLTSTDPSTLGITPASVIIPANATTPAVQPTITGIKPGVSNVRAVASGFAPVIQAVTVTATIAFLESGTVINAPGSQTLTLTLSGPAPAGGLTINLSSSNTNVVTVPATVTFGAGATTVPVTVTGLVQGTAVVHASALPSIADTTTNITVTGVAQIILPATVTVPLGSSAPFAITLPSPAPGSGVTVSLASSDAAKVSITPSSVYIGAGATTPAVQPQVTGLGLVSAAITASAPGYGSASRTVQVTATAAFSPAGSINVGATQLLTLTLSGPAPAGGLTVSLTSSNPSVAQVPGSVTFGAGSTTVSVPVGGVAAGTATIHASAAPNVPDTAITVTVTAGATGIVMPSGVIVRSGDWQFFPVRLTSPAPLGGAFISFTSSDPSKGSVSPGAILIPEGATSSVFTPRIFGYAAGTITITAQWDGFPPVTTTVQVTP